MARKNAGGRSVDDEFPDDDPVDEFDDDAEDEDADEFDDDEDDDEFSDEFDEDDEELEDEAPVGRRRSVATSRASARATKVGARPRTTARTRKDLDTRPGLIGRFINFVREVVAELQKVIWPTRKELLTYTTVVIVFVAIMMSYVAGLDYGFARAMFAVFGHK